MEEGGGSWLAGRVCGAITSFLCLNQGLFTLVVSLMCQACRAPRAIRMWRRASRPGCPRQGQAMGA